MSPAGWLPRTAISSGNICSVIECGLPFFCSLCVCVGHTVNPAKMAELIKMPFVADSCRSQKTILSHRGAHWCHRANMIARSAYGGDETLYQISLATCCCYYILFAFVQYVCIVLICFCLVIILVVFSSLMLLVGLQEGHPAGKKNWVVGCWCGYLSGARCRLAYGSANATATHCLTSVKFRLFLPEKGLLNGCVC